MIIPFLFTWNVFISIHKSTMNFLFFITGQCSQILVRIIVKSWFNARFIFTIIKPSICSNSLTDKQEKKRYCCQPVNDHFSVVVRLSVVFTSTTIDVKRKEKLRTKWGPGRSLKIFSFTFLFGKSRSFFELVRFCHVPRRISPPIQHWGRKIYFSYRVETTMAMNTRNFFSFSSDKEKTSERRSERSKNEEKNKKIIDEPLSEASNLWHPANQEDSVLFESPTTELVYRQNFT